MRVDKAQNASYSHRDESRFLTFKTTPYKNIVLPGWIWAVERTFPSADHHIGHIFFEEHTPWNSEAW